MKNYKIKLKNTEQVEAIRADSELEAKVLYCQRKGYNYRVFANKLEVLDKTGQDKTGK
ncbi:MAG TPA: hypothetical protein PLC05_03545 [bacterium]|nr:hypothetical protein [bacterium]